MPMVKPLTQATPVTPVGDVRTESGFQSRLLLELRLLFLYRYDLLKKERHVARDEPIQSLENINKNRIMRVGQPYG